MKRWKRLGALALTMALTLSLTVLPTHAAVFSDMETHWSRGNVEDLYKKGIAGGYEDGTFRPEGTMSAVEALLFCTRIAGVDSKTQGKIYEDLGEEVRAQIPGSIVSWAAKELSVAVELGILTLDELEDLNQTVPNSINSSVGPTPYLLWNIPREQFAMFLVRAMQLGPLAQSLDVDFCTSYLNTCFVDVENITPKYRPYIYVLYNFKIMGGEPTEDEKGIQISPNRNLKRGETAALISRAIAAMEEMGLFAEAAEYTTYPWASGTIEEAASNLDGTVTLTLSDPIGGTEIYTLPSDVAIYDEYNMKGTIRDLTGGTYVRLVMEEADSDPYLVRILGDPTSLTGRVITYDDQGITLWVDGARRTLEFSRFTQFKAGGITGDKTILDADAAYANAVCYLDGKGTLTGVELTGGTVRREGILSSVTLNTNGATLTLKDSTGIGASYIVPTDAQVMVNSKEGTLSSTYVGYPTILRVSEENSTVVSVSVDTSIIYIQGPITNQTVSSGIRRITFQNTLDNNQSVSASLDPDAVITYDGVKRAATQINNNWFATAKVEGGIITELTAYSATATVEGIISELSYGADTTILYVTQAGGGEQSYPLDMANLPEITRDGKNSSLAQLRKGDSITITLRYHQVEKLEAKAREANLTGEIRQIIQGQDGMKVTVKLSDGSEAVYTVSSSLAVTKDSKALTYRDLSYGDQIAFIANGSELVSVEILSSTTAVGNPFITGTVLTVSTAGSNRLIYLLIDGNDDPQEINVRNAAIQDSNGKSIPFSSVSVGLKSGDSLTIFGAWNGSVFEATMVIKTNK